MNAIEYTQQLIDDGTSLDEAIDIVETLFNLSGTDINRILIEIKA